MTPVLVLAYDGEVDAAPVIAALAAAHDAAVVTVTLDLGQSGDVRATRDAALAGGAVRAHVFDDVEAFVRRCVLPALRATPSGVPAPAPGLAHPLLAARLVDVAHLEGARLVAHGGGDRLSQAIRAVDPSLHVLTLDPTRFGPPAPRRVRPSRHLLQRPIADPARARGGAARVVLDFADGIPVAINGVTLTPPELMESLSLIAGARGIGHAEAADAPGFLVLDTAYRALAGSSGVVSIELLDGQQRVVSSTPRVQELVNLA